MAWALLLPLSIVFAWLVIPDQPPVKLLEQVNTTSLPVVIASKKTIAYEINLRTKADSAEWQLEWKNKIPLTIPSAAIYHITNPVSEITKNKLIGRIEARGSYFFPIKINGNSKGTSIVLYDFIHNKIIETIHF